MTTVIVLVIGILSAVIALYGGFISSQIIDDFEEVGATGKTIEDRYYLVGMISTIVLLARILIVPVYFWMLQSLVPYCPGAMCVYGVTNVSQPYSTISIASKIFLPAAYGMWLLVDVSNRREPTLPLLHNLVRSFLIILLPILLIDSISDVLVVASIPPVYAACCSSVYDVDPPFSPSALFGEGIGMMILGTTMLLSVCLIITQWLEMQRTQVRFISLILSGMCASLYFITIHDTFAPLVLGLSTHHCPYCLFQEFPDTALFAGMFWVGVATAVWRIVIEHIWAQKSLNQNSIAGISIALRKVSSVALLFSMVSLVSHVLVAI